MQRRPSYRADHLNGKAKRLYSTLSTTLRTISTAFQGHTIDLLLDIPQDASQSDRTKTYVLVCVDTSRKRWIRPNSQGRCLGCTVDPSSLECCTSKQDRQSTGKHPHNDTRWRVVTHQIQIEMPKSDRERAVSIEAGREVIESEYVPLS